MDVEYFEDLLETDRKFLAGEIKLYGYKEDIRNKKVEFLPDVLMLHNFQILIFDIQISESAQLRYPCVLGLIVREGFREVFEGLPKIFEGLRKVRMNQHGQFDGIFVTKDHDLLSITIREATCNADVLKFVVQTALNTKLFDNTKLDPSRSYFTIDEYEQYMMPDQSNDTILAPFNTDCTQRELQAAKMQMGRCSKINEYTNGFEDYDDEIYSYYRQLEISMAPDPNYFIRFEGFVRSDLIKWIIYLHRELELKSEVLYLAVNYTDRFLSTIAAVKNRKLLGVAALSISAKFEDRYFEFEVQDLCDISGVSIDKLIKAEGVLLRSLKYKLSWPGPYYFLRRMRKGQHMSSAYLLAKCILKDSIIDPRLIACPPSYLAAAAYCFARLLHYEGSWEPCNVYYSGYTYSQIRYLLPVIMECSVVPRRVLPGGGLITSYKY